MSETFEDVKINSRFNEYNKGFGPFALEALCKRFYDAGFEHTDRIRRDLVILGKDSTNRANKLGEQLTEKDKLIEEKHA